MATNLSSPARVPMTKAGPDTPVSCLLNCLNQALILICLLFLVGVATFCRVKSAFSSNEVALPIAAEEGFTGLVDNSKTGKHEMLTVAQVLEEFEKDDLLKIDSEGRCIITDHAHFGTFSTLVVFDLVSFTILIWN